MALLIATSPPPRGPRAVRTPRGAHARRVASVRGWGIERRFRVDSRSLLSVEAAQYADRRERDQSFVHEKH
jgi:hypothetical protein